MKDKINFHRWWAFYYGSNQQNEKAIIELEQLINLVPDDFEVCYRLGYLLVEAKRLHDASNVFRSASSIVPENFEMYMYIGYILAQSYDLDKYIPNLSAAKDLFLKALKLNPDSAAAHFSYGSALLREWKWKEAEMAYREAIQKDSNHAEAWVALGYVFFHMKQFDESALCYQNAVDLRPENVTGLYGLSCALLKQRNFDKAIETLRECIRLDPLNGKVNYSLSMALEELGNFDEAFLILSNMKSRTNRDE